MDMEKMKALFADKTFVKYLFALETPAEAQAAALKEKGAELTEAEIRTIRDLLVNIMDGKKIGFKDSELPEELLEAIAGGKEGPPFPDSVDLKIYHTKFG